jgi:hypothetical protein
MEKLTDKFASVVESCFFKPLAMAVDSMGWDGKANDGNCFGYQYGEPAPAA